MESKTWIIRDNMTQGLIIIVIIKSNVSDNMYCTIYKNITIIEHSWSTHNQTKYNK